MKNKIVMIAAFLAVMVSMTGIAVATSVDIDTTSSVDFIYNKLDGVTKTTVDVRVYGMEMSTTGNRWIGVSTDNINLHARLYGNGIDITSDGIWVGAVRSVSASTTEQTFTLEVWGTEKGAVVVQDNLGNSQETDPTKYGKKKVGIGTSDVDIPEFPTVALPIAAVIGLVFFFHSRKNKEE